MGWWEDAQSAFGTQANRLGYWMSNGFDGRSAAEKEAAAKQAQANVLTTTAKPADIPLAEWQKAAQLAEQSQGAVQKKIETSMNQTAGYINKGGGGGGLNLGNVGTTLGAAGAAALPYVPGIAALGLPLLGSAIGGGGQGADASGYDAERLKLEQARQDNINASVGRIKDISNPYDTNSEAWQKSLALALNNTTRQSAGADRRLNDEFLARGMGGSGQAMSAQALLAAHRTQALSDTENRMYADALTRRSDFELQRENAILAGLNGSNDLGQALADLARTQREKDNQNRSDLIGAAGATVNWLTQNWDKLAPIAKQFGFGSAADLGRAVNSGTAPSALMDLIPKGAA